MNFFSLFKRKLIYKLKKKIFIDRDKIKLNSLDELFHYYGSDKANIFLKKNSAGHGFSKFYTKHLQNFKNKKINILEIGSFAGASAAALNKYFPESKIFCFDINISNFKYHSDRIYVFGLDITNKKNVSKTLEKIFNKFKFNKFDLIIDDGSHNLSDILISLNIFFKLLKNNGIYVIEDFKFPNYFDYNRNTDDILVDQLLEKLKNKEHFQSKYFSNDEQSFLMNSISDISTYKGNLPESDICFIRKN